MDADRVRAYLQIACAGLGFDIGEIWWSQSQEGNPSSATVVAIGELFLVENFLGPVYASSGTGSTRFLAEGGKRPTGPPFRVTFRVSDAWC